MSRLRRTQTDPSRSFPTCRRRRSLPPPVISTQGISSILAFPSFQLCEFPYRSNQPIKEHSPCLCARICEYSVEFFVYIAESDEWRKWVKVKYRRWWMEERLIEFESGKKQNCTLDNINLFKDEFVKSVENVVNIYFSKEKSCIYIL